MDDETSSDLQKCLSETPMDTDEGPLINENSNGLSHLLTENEFNSVDAAVDESSTSNQGFLNAVELSAGCVGDYLENNTTGSFGTDAFDVGDNAVTFATDSLNNVLSDGDSRLSDNTYKHITSDTEGKMDNDLGDISNDVEFSMTAEDDSMQAKTDDEKNTLTETEDTINDDLKSYNKNEIEDSNTSNKVEEIEDSNSSSKDVLLVSNKISVSVDNVEASKPTQVVISELTIVESSEPAKVETSEPTNVEPTESTNVEPTEPMNVDASTAVKESEPMNVEKSGVTNVEESNATNIEASEPTYVKTSEANSVKKSDSSSVKVSRPSDVEAPEQTNVDASKPTDVDASKSNDVNASKPTDVDASKPNDVDASKPTDVDATKTTDVDAPKTTDVDGSKTNDVDVSSKEQPKESEVKKKLEKAEATEDSSAKEPVKKSEQQVGGAEETEVVSEDELPTVQKPSIKDAENVSDDELPGPKPAELPADTEVVSEDELPASKKDAKESRKRKPDDPDGYDPGSPTSEPESSSKKQAVAKNGESKPIPAEKRTSVDEKPKKKALPELDKYWKVVNDDPTDFTGWTYLLQYVDQESDVEAAREAYDAFLSHYPYCYGYWRKYADYEKRKGSKKKCLEVLERGLKAIPLSVDLWIHYLNHIKATRTDDHIFIRSQYERAVEACGLEFRSDRLWESYIKWEAENGSALNVTNIYDRLLATPTLGYTSHFDNFQEHVMSEPVSGVVSVDEVVRLRAEVRAAAPAAPQLDLPPGEDEPPDHVASDEEAQAIKERIIAARRKVHKTTGEEVAARWTFEEGIKRPYFHVKPLERCQLKNWKLYLEWEKQHGSLKRALVLHERCLIACALYEEFWMRLIKFLEERSATEPWLVNVEREVLERACTVHHLDKPDLHLHWAHFEEAHGNHAKAAEILDRIEKTCPNIVQIQYRRVNLERRRGDLDKCAQLYENYISSAKNKAVASALAIKYARFQFHVRHDPPAARKVLDDAINKDPLNSRLHMQRLDLALHTPDTPYEELEELATSYEKKEGAEPETCLAMAWRRRELAEELGSAAAARAAHQTAKQLAKQLRKRARKDRTDPPPPPSTDSTKKKEASNTTPASVTTASSSSYYQTGPTTATSYEQSYAQPYQPPWGYQQAPPPYQHHPHPWPQYTNYY